MHIFESHCHLDDRSFTKDLNHVIQRARSAEVAAMMVVGVDPVSSQRAVTLASEYPDIYASVGIHPHDAQKCNEREISHLTKLAEHDKVRAWGETGLDFNRMFSPQHKQELCFVHQLETAASLNLPMIFHERDSNGRFTQPLAR